MLNIMSRVKNSLNKNNKIRKENIQRDNTNIVVGNFEQPTFKNNLIKYINFLRINLKIVIPLGLIMLCLLGFVIYRNTQNNSNIASSKSSTPKNTNSSQISSNSNNSSSSKTNSSSATSQKASSDSQSISPTATTVSSNSQPYWLINDGELNGMVNAGLSNTLLQYFFNNPKTLLLVGSSSSIDNSLPNASKVEKFDSEANLANSNFTAGVKYIAYDNEAWQATPGTEQQNPISYARQAENIVHQHGLKFIFTPAVNLAPKLTSNPSGSKYTDYINENIAGQGALVSDILEIQAQQIQEQTSTFNTFVSQSISQARAAAPSNPVLIGLTTNTGGTTFTAQSMMNAYNNIKNIANGYWINVSSSGGPPQPQVAISFLQQLYSISPH